GGLGALGLALAGALLWGGLHRAGGTGTPGTPGGPGAAAVAATGPAPGAVPAAATAERTAAGVYPVRVDARLDEPLSPWMWLVKWFLAIPHAIVLAFLWIALSVLTVVAFFAI